MFDYSKYCDALSSFTIAKIYKIYDTDKFYEKIKYISCLYLKNNVYLQYDENTFPHIPWVF